MRAERLERAGDGRGAGRLPGVRDGRQPCRPGLGEDPRKRLRREPRLGAAEPEADHPSVAKPDGVLRHLLGLLERELTSDVGREIHAHPVLLPRLLSAVAVAGDVPSHDAPARTASVGPKIASIYTAPCAFASAA